MNKGYYLTNYRKFTELLIYVLSKFDEGVNETKLLKLLYFSDANFFEKNQSTISGNVTYYKNHFGPTPNAKILMNLYDALSDLVSREERTSDGFTSRKIRLKSDDFTFKTLSAREIETIDSTLDKYGNLSVSEIVKLSHFDPPFLASDKHKKIQFEFVRHRKSDDDYEAHLQEELRKAIAKDVSRSSLKRLRDYAGAAA